MELKTISRREYKKTLTLPGSVLLVVMLLTVSGCERLAPIQVENKTSEILTVYIDKYRIGDVKPGDKIENNMVLAGRDWYLIKAHDTRGNAIYSHKFYHEELKKIDWKVVIAPD